MKEAKRARRECAEERRTSLRKRERERRKKRGMPSKDAQQGKVIGVDNRSRRKKGMREKGGGRERHWRKMRTPKDRKGEKKEEKV